MINLANARREVTVVHEVLRQRRQVGVAFAKIPGVGEHPGLFRVKAGHERRAAGIADWVLAVGTVELHATLGQAVYVGRLDERMAVAAEVVIEVIDRNKQNVGPLGLRRLA